MGCTESKAAKTAGSKDGDRVRSPAGANKDKKKKNNKGKHARAAGGIESFAPDDRTLAAYLRYLDAVRHDAALKGVMAPTAPTMGFPPTPKSKKKDKPSPTSARSPSEQFHGQSGSLSSPSAAADGTTPAGLQRTVSAYCCRPLVVAANNNPMLVGRGLYSSVYLADLTVLAGPPENVAAQLVAVNQPCDGIGGGQDDAVFRKRYLIAMKEVRLFARQRTLTTIQKFEDHARRWARVSAYCPGLVQCILMEQVFDDTDGKGTSLSVACPHASPHYVPSVSPVRTLGTLVLSDATNADEPADDGARGSRVRRFGRGKGGPFAGSTDNSNQMFTLAAKGKTAAALAAVTEPVAPASTSGSPPRTLFPNRLRLYVEFQRYGTLRNMQPRVTPQHFQRNHMHELTARAIMYDVLKTLAHLHAQDSLQYDLSANAIFIHHPVRAVYHTFFPAYISDLAAGDWRTLKPAQWKAALVLGDPATDEKGDYDGCHAASGVSGKNHGNNPNNDTGDRPASGARGGDLAGTPPLGARGQRPSELTPALMANWAPSSLQHAEPLSPLFLAHPNASLAVNLHDLHLDTSLAHIASYSSGAPSPSSTGVWSPSRAGFDGLTASNNNVSFAAAGMELLANMDLGDQVGDGTKPPLLDWSNEKLKQCMEANGYEDCEGPPLPSPHDGAACQDDQNQFVANTLHETAASLLELQTVAAINATHAAAPVLPSATDSNSNGKNECGGESASASPSNSVKAEKSVGAAAATDASAQARTASPGAALYGSGGVVLWAPDRFPPSSLTRAMAPETRHAVPPQTLTATTNTQAFARSSEPFGLSGPPAVGDESDFASEQLRLLQQHSTDAHHRRRRPPITKLNHVAALRRVLAASMAGCSTADVPAHKYVSTAHAAPEALLHRQFTKASDVYAFAMTFIELVTPDGAIMADCAPTTQPKTRAEKAEHDEALYNNLCKWYNTRMTFMATHKDAVAEEQRLPPCVQQPPPPPCLMPVPEHLSDECKRMLRWCLQTDPEARPTAAQLLSSKYFLFGDWISKGEPSCPSAQLPEKPWLPLPASYEELAESAGLKQLASVGTQTPPQQGR